MLVSVETSADLSFGIPTVSEDVDIFDVPVSAGNVFASVVAVVVAVDGP